MTKKIVSPVKGFTDAFIQHLKPQEKRFDVADSSCAGLRVRVGSTGKKSFVWFYSDPTTKKLKMKTLGRYGTGNDQLTLQQARKTLQTAKIKLEAGELDSTTPSTPKTVAELCETFYEKRILPHRKAPEAVRQVIDHDVIPVIGNKNISTISPVAIVNCVDKVVLRGAATHAGKVLAILKQMFKFAEAKGYIDRSPAYSLERKDLGIIEIKRDRWLATEEIKPTWDAIGAPSKMSLPTINGLKILMLVGCRTGELLKTEWKHIDFNRREWFIPKENTKTLQAWTIPLTPQVISLLQELISFDSIHVFSGKGGALSDKVMSRALHRLFETKKLDINPVRPHDLRRTVRTHLEMLGAPPHICEKCLNHSLGSIDSIYNQNDYLAERREALEKWNDFVMRQVNPQSNVIEFQRVG